MVKTTSESLEFRLALLAKAKHQAKKWEDFSRKQIPFLRYFGDQEDFIKHIEEMTIFNKNKVVQLVALLNQQLSNS